MDAREAGSDNITVVSHLPLGAPLSVADIEIEQEMHRPYAYVAREVFGEYGEKGMDVIDLSDPANPEVIHAWRIENQDLHTGAGSKDIKYFVWEERYYVVLSVQFGQGGPNPDLGAIIFDVTDLPEKIEEVARIRETDLPGGFHNIFLYQHSNGRPLLFTTVRGPGAHVYDLGHVISGHMEDALVAQVPVGDGPDGNRGYRGYHDLYVGWHPDTQSDRFYGGGTDGYYVYDVTNLENPQLVVSLTGISGVQYGHTFTPRLTAATSSRKPSISTRRCASSICSRRSTARPRTYAARSRRGRPTGATWCTTTRFAGRSFSCPATSTAFRSSP